MEQIQMSIGKQIKHYRLRKSVRQEDLAEYLGVSCQAVSKWETESSMPDITLLPRLAVYFGIAIDDLFRVSTEEQLTRIDNALDAAGEMDDCTFAAYSAFLDGLTGDAAYRLRAHATLAQLYNRRAAEDRAQAMQHAQQAVELDPEGEEAYCWPDLIEAHGGCCGDEWYDNHSDLIEYLKGFLARHPGHFRCLYALIENLLADGRYDEAAQHIPAVAAFPGRGYMADIYMGDVARGRGDLQAARALWDRAVEQNPGVWQAWCSRADRVKKLGLYEQALSDYEKCYTMQNAPRISDGLYSRAQLLEQLGRYADAIVERERIIDCLINEFGLDEDSAGVAEQRREIARLRRR